MAFSKTSKVWFSAVGGGLLAAAGGVLLVTGVGSGAGAVLITSGLAAIGGIVGGGMLAGIGVLTAGSATVAALSAAIAHGAIKDPDRLALAKKLEEAIHTAEALRQASYNSEAAAVDQIRHEIEWSAYVVRLVGNVQAASRRHGVLGKLRFLLYPAGLTASDAAWIRAHGDGVVWLVKE
ncbi:MAG: hypothetical protein WCG85_26970 [Polyangia bacterium]